MGIYVGNLSDSATEQDMAALFTEYGTVANVRIPVDRETGRVHGFGFVDVSSDDEENSAIEARDSAEWMSRILRANKARPCENPPLPSGGDRTSQGWS